jgi:hypothetical protein
MAHAHESVPIRMLCDQYVIVATTFELKTPLFVGA